jgi:3-hydroxy-9,10-secoandrosta-1,3,5(10)-triene-9,17-dione monooxygenase
MSTVAASSAVPASSLSDYAERARSIVDQLRTHAYEAEKLRRLPRESVQLLRENGLTRIIQSSACGGLGLSMRAHVDVVSTVAEGCSATAWVLGVCHAHSWMMGHFPQKAQDEVYGRDPDTIVSAVIGPRGKAILGRDGSYVLNGTWPFASGSEHSEWLLLGAETFDESGNKLDEADLLVPTSSVVLKDDWFVAGLQGTGSCSVVAANVPVPAYRALSLSKLIERDLDSYRSSETSWLTKAQAVPVLTLCLCSGALGIARAALAEFGRAARGKKVMYTAHISHEWIPNQVVLGRAASLVNAAELLLYRVADEIDNHALAGVQMPMALRGRIRMDCSLAVRFCLDAVESLYMNGGASFLSLSSPLQRGARDLRATNMHGLLLLETSAEVYGRILFGLEPNTPIV